jgi:hypothetical protein
MRLNQVSSNDDNKVIEKRSEEVYRIVTSNLKGKAV